MPLPPETPPPGVNAFAPADDTLLTFLRQKLAGEPLPAAAVAHFHDADIYTADPATLTAGYRPAPEKNGEGGSCWFFFTRVRPKSERDSRKSRHVGGGVGTWHSERAPRQVLDGDGNCVGQVQYFSYKRTVGKNCRERSDWYMVEFSEDHGADHERVHGGEPQLVLCKIYKAHACSSSRSARGCASRQSSRKKRKTTDDHRADLASASAPVVKAKRRLFDPSVLVPAATSSQDKITSSLCESFDTFWTPEVQALHSQLDISSFFMAVGDDPPASAHALCSASWISDSAFSAEQDPHDPTHSSWMSETDAPQVDTDSFLMARDAPAAPAHRTPGSSASWTSNNTTSSSSSKLGWFLGAPTGDDELSRAVGRFTNKCITPSSNVLPQVTVAPSWCCIPDIRTC